MGRARGMLLAGAVAAALAALPIRGGAEPRTPPVAPPLCGTEAGNHEAGTKDAIRVATFNVLHGLEETPAYPTHSTLDERLELAAQELASEGVDVAGMQEVSLTEAPAAHEPGLVVQRMAGRLTELTGESWHWCWYLANPHVPVEPDLQPGGGGPLSDEIARRASGNYGSFKEGAAVLSRYPILAAEARRLPLRFPGEYVACPPSEVPTCNLTAIFDHRIALWARVDTPGGPTDLIATHLAHDITPLSDVSTFEQAAAVLAFSQQMVLIHGEPARRFITCDCNVQTTDQPPVVALITGTGWTDTYPAANPGSACAPPGDTSACTSDQDILAPASTTTERIDYVFARAGFCDLGLVGSAKIADAPTLMPDGSFLWPSDHHGVATTVSVAGCAAGY